MSDAATLEKEQSLCQTCGLCCKGIVLSGVRLKNEERPWAVQHKIEVIETEHGPAFALPCRECLDGSCACYEVRPNACRSFRCGLLEALQAQRINATDAAQIVGELLADVQLINDLFCARSRSAFWKVAAHAADPSTSAEQRKQLLASMGEAAEPWQRLREKLDRYIHMPSLPQQEHGE